MITLTLDPKSKTPLYIQLYGGIKKLILEGALKENEKLPSKRSLSSHLKISVLTVENEAVSLAAFYQEKGKYILRLVNNNDSAQTTKLVLQGKTFNAAFGKYEVKTFVYDGKSLIEKEIWY